MKNELYVKAAIAIKHFGTKGMRWGVRTKGKRSSSSESKTSRKLSKKKAFELTNDELKTVNARLSLEKQFSQLNPSATAKASKAVAGVLGNIAKQTITEVGTKYATKYAKKILEGG
jgi:hypothetical protein